MTKINASGSALVYSTYLGGIGVDEASGIAVDSSGSAYVTGTTFSTNFPTTPGAFQKICNGGKGCSRFGDAFVAKLSPAGAAFVYSTYLGGHGSDSGFGIAVDSAGNAHVTGAAGGGFPLANPLQKLASGAFVTEFNHTGSALVYSTYLGGSSGITEAFGIAVDGSGNAYVTGNTGATDFPTENALQATYGGGPDDAFVAKLYITAATTTTLSSSQNPSTHGQAVIFTAVVSSALGTPPDGETVSFMKGKTVLGTGSLSGGSASFTTSGLPVGTNLIKAMYSGDSNFSGSTSNAVKQVVN